MRVEDKIYQLPIKMVSSSNSPFIPPPGTVIQGVLPVGVSATYKGKSRHGFGDDFSTTGVYATGSALEVFSGDPSTYTEITVTVGRVKVYYGSL